MTICEYMHLYNLMCICVFCSVSNLTDLTLNNFDFLIMSQQQSANIKQQSTNNVPFFPSFQFCFQGNLYIYILIYI